ncbi:MULTISPECIES: rRNA cytosine-C5-methyltransferase [unclassified Parabacteroides]|uniref:methyltransferase RsmF C-terminal domain-like protein n=1 Tax=unclassified Parabacteroides TaxID=2649774 RepID=UPI002473B73D|nr:MULTISPECIES: rRNA cytosine-C5-methyltransferase [unclassified Parabacteroides]
MQLPVDFITRTKELLADDFRRLEVAVGEEAPVSIRVNAAKRLEGLPYERVAWCETGYYLPERLSFTFDPLFHAGAYYVQEASSMFLEQAIRAYVDKPVKCLDLCAAPGGKSTHLLSVLPEGSLLVSNEVIRNRSNILSENIIKWGNPYFVVTNNDPADFDGLAQLFDVLVADVPCSGEGMFRKDPNSINEWSVSNVQLCAARQKRIIQDIWDTLKPGGLLIYSTCTYNTEENEDNIHYIVNDLGATPLPLPLKEEWGVSGGLKYDYPVYRFFPHKTKGEGFFLAVLRKNEGEVVTPKIKPSKEKKKASQPIPPEVRQWLSEPDLFNIELRNNTLEAFPVAYKQEHMLISNALRMVSFGIQLGEIKGKDVLPAHPLAMSTYLNRNVFPLHEVSYEEAIQYLRKEVLQLPPELPKGYVLLTYKGSPLGFVKQLGNRANNLYPQEWRIRSGYLPEKITCLPF